MHEAGERELVYAAWAPTKAVWSKWVKPVLFSAVERFPLSSPATAMIFDLNWVPPADRDTALILDLPGDEGVLLGMELARRGFRPVPLYNGLPGPTATISLTGGAAPLIAPLVDVLPIIYAIQGGAEELLKLPLPENAPPVFLLDAHRRTGRRDRNFNCFDNRSVSFVTDFPSTGFLKEQGVGRVVLVQRSEDQPQADLAHTLRHWHDEGMKIELKRLDRDDAMHPLTLRRYSRLGDFWYRLCALFRLVPNRLGGYGGIVGGVTGG